jgi:hypothetical protein
LEMSSLWDAVFIRVLDRTGPLMLNLSWTAYTKHGDLKSGRPSQKCHSLRQSILATTITISDLLKRHNPTAGPISPSFASTSCDQDCIPYIDEAFQAGPHLAGTGIASRRILAFVKPESLPILNDGRLQWRIYHRSGTEALWQTHVLLTDCHLKTGRRDCHLVDLRAADSVFEFRLRIRWRVHLTCGRSTLTSGEQFTTVNQIHSIPIDSLRIET